MEETALVQLAIRKDEGAWESLVHAHQEPVFRLAYLFCGDPDEAEDITQETFIRAFRAIHTFDAARPLRPWLLGIAANLARNRLRGMRRYLAALQRSAQRDPRAVQAESGPGPGVRDVWEKIRRMSSEDQHVLYLRYFLELSEEETADALGIPRGTVKSRSSRALARLRAHLAVEAGDE